MLSVSPTSAFSFSHALLQPPPPRPPPSYPRRSPHQIPAATKKPSSAEMVANQVEVMKSLEGWATENMLSHLKPVEESWQPQDFLPDSSKPLDEYMEEVRALKERTAGLSDDYFVVLVGDMITEEALPTYQSAISGAHGFRPGSGADPGPWATWTRGWSSEENRHGDLLHTYLYLSGRVDMAMVQRTTHYLIASGMVLFNARPGAQQEPYATAVYTSFQEGATAVSHGNTARLAKQHGDLVLARICGSITADEKRHQRAYAGMVRKLVEVDPNGAMLAIGETLRSRILMPAHLMYDGREPQTFRHFAAVAQRLGVYTGWDYADIMEHLVGVWGLEKVEQGLTPEGRKEQEFVCGLAARIRRLQEGTEEKAKKMKPHPVKFSWIFDRELTLYR